MDKSSRIYVAGKFGMVGRALFRVLSKNGYTNLSGHSRDQLDLTNQNAVLSAFQKERPDYVFMAAAKVGGIQANNTYPADFIFSNICIQNNVIHAAYLTGVKKLLFLGSSCIYPKFAPQPIPESALLSGPLEPTNEAYAIAKIAGIKMCESYNKQYGTDFISCMPTNLYGPFDNYDLYNSHVLPALLRKIHEAKVKKAETYTVWGTGTPKREFLYVDDLAEACLFLMEKYTGSAIVNIGSSEEISIGELAKIIAAEIEYPGSIEFDATKPDGTPRKFLDSSKIIAMGWRPKIKLSSGIQVTYENFLSGNIRN